MKNLIIALIALLPASLFAQTSLDNFYSKYAGKEGFTTVNISPGLFELIASADLDDEDISVIKEITGVNVLVYENENEKEKNIEMAKQLTKEAYAALGSGYKELVSVKESGTDIKIMARSTSNGIVNDLLIVGNDDGEFIYVNITGKMDLKKLKDLDGKVDIDCFDHLKDIDVK
jgi:hypothetical protein